MRRLLSICKCFILISVIFTGCAGNAPQAPTPATANNPTTGNAAITTCVNATPMPSPTPVISKEEVHYQSDGYNMVGYVFKPQGNGPFPTIIWNHGSEQNPDQGPEFDSIAAQFVPKGYVVFAPVRRGHGTSEGPYIVDATQEYGQTHTPAETKQWLVEQFSGPQLDDELAGLTYAKNLPYVDKDHLAVMGCSYGGIMTLLGAEHPGTGYKTAVAISPAAESWKSVPLENRLITATQNINIPVFLIHPAKDVNLDPGYVLGKSFQDQGKAYSLRIYPPFGPDEEQGHCFGGAKGDHVWAPDVSQFLKQSLP